MAATPLVLVDQAAKGHREAAALAAILAFPVLEGSAEPCRVGGQQAAYHRATCTRSSVTKPNACSSLKPRAQ